MQIPEEGYHTIGRRYAEAAVRLIKSNEAMRFSYLFSLLLAAQLSAQQMAFDESWKFIRTDVPGAEQPGYDDTKWRTLDLPHDWSIEGAYAEDNPMGDRGGYLPAGIGWYRKTISVPRNWKGKHVEIAFDGIYRNSTVYANGKELGFRPYGWISFAYDISEFTASNEITFAVRVDNRLQPAARWYTGSGIYAHVRIDVKDPVHLVRDGQFIRTDGEQVTVDSEVINKRSAKQQLAVTTSVVDTNGIILASSKQLVGAAAGAMEVVRQSLSVPNALRWSVSSPTLYRLRTEVHSAGRLLDQRETRFGFRDVEWRPATGVWIDGVNVKLQGVCNHQDAGALGAAVPDKILRFRLEQLKKMGVNAIRTAHNPQTPVFYDLCDEMGILVMVEIFYTTDGTEPTAQSRSYTAPFSVSPGTRVRALIIAQGKTVLHLEERFGADEGFVWNDPNAVEPSAGEQAETATFVNAEIKASGGDFHGEGYLSFPQGSSGHVEWYQENDGEEGPAEILLRYSAGGNQPLTARLIVNGQVADPAMRLKGQGRLGEFWGVFKATINLQRGANTVRVEAPGETTLLIDEIIIR